jgi:uncharacterized protein (DUF305 family)
VVLSRRRIAVLAGVLAAVALGVVLVLRFSHGAPSPEPGQPRVVQPGAPGQPGRTLSAGDLASITPPAHNPADTLFMQRMIVHHTQALTMTALTKDHDASAGVRQMAERIEISQRDEITQMRRWLTERGEPAADPHAGHAAMPGMLTDAQIDRLRAARGAQFDRLFLELMIAHHQGALTMVEQLYASGGGLEPASDRFAREVNADQNVEIARMRTMLAQSSSEH